MKLSISNIAWSQDLDDAIYNLLQSEGLDGIEIAPTRIYPEAPYSHTDDAVAWSSQLSKKYQLAVSSMQSIWYGRTENLFRSVQERTALLDYTKMAIDFAAAINCHNLVFGCPRNRNMDASCVFSDSIDFFHELGEYAAQKGTVLALEPNPTIYHTNFINTTTQAIELIREVSSKGFLLNLDIGTMLYNEESPEILKKNLHLIHHIHISEPGLACIQPHELHYQLADILRSGYDHYISIEMGRQDDIHTIQHAIHYMKGLFA